MTYSHGSSAVSPAYLDDLTAGFQGVDEGMGAERSNQAWEPYSLIRLRFLLMELLPDAGKFGFRSIGAGLGLAKRC